jgi:NADPH-dependent 2,4-dienoyl-CoA reductase/sulfur reductase-like enzyme
MSEHTVVVGAGPAGIATAISLHDRGLRPLVVDRAAEVASSWRARYDRLKLNTGRQFSHLPGRAYPKGTPTFPTRDQVIDHFDVYVREAGVELRLNTEVTRIDTLGGGWRLQTSTGDIDARHVVVATGLMHTPSIPEWAGEFTGELLHSSQYRNPGPYAGKRALVVGCGSSGMEIAHDLATGGAAKVWMAVRTPPNIMLRGGPGGLPGEVIALPLFYAPIRLADALAVRARRSLIGDLTEFGLPIPDEGPFCRLARLGAVPSLVDLEVIDAIRDRSIEVVAGVDCFDGGGVRLIDGGRLEPDVVICATGYRSGLDQMAGHLGVLDERGEPRAHGDQPAAPGLWFIGFSRRPALISFMGKQSRQLAKAIANG